jgi:hypothetical protein
MSHHSSLSRYYFKSIIHPFAFEGHQGILCVGIVWYAIEQCKRLGEGIP